MRIPDFPEEAFRSGSVAAGGGYSTEDDGPGERAAVEYCADLLARPSTKKMSSSANSPILHRFQSADNEPRS
jgi:hypothetical protein